MEWLHSAHLLSCKTLEAQRSETDDLREVIYNLLETEINFKSIRDLCATRDSDQNSVQIRTSISLSYQLDCKQAKTASLTLSRQKVCLYMWSKWYILFV